MHLLCFLIFLYYSYQYIFIISLVVRLVYWCGMDWRSIILFIWSFLELINQMTSFVGIEVNLYNSSTLGYHFNKYTRLMSTQGGYVSACTKYLYAWVSTLNKYARLMSTRGLCISKHKNEYTMATSDVYQPPSKQFRISQPTISLRIKLTVSIHGYECIMFGKQGWGNL